MRRYIYVILHSSIFLQKPTEGYIFRYLSIRIYKLCSIPIFLVYRSIPSIEMLGNNILIKKSPGINDTINLRLIILIVTIFVRNNKISFRIMGFKDANLIKPLVAIGAFGKLRI